MNSYLQIVVKKSIQIGNYFLTPLSLSQCVTDCFLCVVVDSRAAMYEIHCIDICLALFFGTNKHYFLEMVGN